MGKAATKASKNRPGVRDRTLAAMLVNHYESHLYGINASESQAKQLLKEECGFDASGMSLRRIGKVAAPMWASASNGEHRRKSRRVNFTGKEWFKMTDFISRHGITPTDTVASLCRRMRRAGILASLHATREAAKTCGLVLPEKPAKPEIGGDYAG